MFFILPCIDSYQKVDLRVVSFDVPPQEVQVTKWFVMYLGGVMALWMKHWILDWMVQVWLQVKMLWNNWIANWLVTYLQVLTKDSVTVAVDAVVYFRIYNATMSITNVENANRSTRLLAQTTLRNVLGTKNLSEILGEREGISDTMQVRIISRKFFE